MRLSRCAPFDGELELEPVLGAEAEVLWKGQVGESNVGDTSFFVRMAVHGPCLELGITEMHAVGGDVRRSKLMGCIRWNVHWLDGTVVDGLLAMVMAQRRRGTYILSQASSVPLEDQQSIFVKPGSQLAIEGEDNAVPKGEATRSFAME